MAAGCVAALERGRGHYLLTGHYVTISAMIRDAVALAGRPWRRPELPMWLAKAVAPAVELSSRVRGVPPTFTAYSLHELEAPCAFCHDRATRELEYRPRPWAETLADTVASLTGGRPAA